MDTHTDEFYFSITSIPDDCIYTKREVLSRIAKLFDPAGWLAPIVIQAKIIMQKIWMDRTDWDDTISLEALQLWKSFQSNYSSINNLTIPRRINFPDSEIQIHGFSDASEKAYSAALYIRVRLSNYIYSHLIS